MRIVKLDQKRGILKAIIKSYDDLIILSYIIEKGDKLIAYSRRKIKVGSSQEIKLVKIGIEVESTALTENALGISGRILSSSDENVPLHKYHTIDMRPRNGFVLQKEKLLSFQAHMVVKSQERSPKILICVYEEGYAIFYKITNYSLKRLYEIKENVSGKRFKNESRSKFLAKLVDNIIEEYNKAKWNLVIVAGKAMENEELKKTPLKDLNVNYETVSYADTGLKEIIGKDKVSGLLKNTKISTQRNLIKEYINEISNGNTAYVYGLEKIQEKIRSSRPEEALLSKEFVMARKQVVEQLDEAGTNIVFFDEKDESLDLLNGFGGAILKFS
jgi:stalled ribosome rescue protein Dom34